jgi:hypothetical protein
MPEHKVMFMVKQQAYDDAVFDDMSGKEGRPKYRYLDPMVQEFYEGQYYAYLQDLRGESPVYHGNEWNKE